MPAMRGLSSPVVVADSVDRNRNYSDTTLSDLLALTDEQLAMVDPLAMNLLVATGIPALADLEIGYYQTLVNNWVSDFTARCLPEWEPYFHKTPGDFRNDIQYFRLGMVCQYLEQQIGIRYIEDQREVTSIRYTNPSDLFLNGVLDTGQGTCGNLAALHVAFGWRLRWPVSLARVNSHFICRFDNGQVTYNIEATQSGYGGFKSDPDEYLITEKKLPPSAIANGSDLRALKPKEVLGEFIGLRARHLRDVGMDASSEAEILESEVDWLLARQLCPASRQLYKNQMMVSTLRGDVLFEVNEAGHPLTYAGCLEEIRAQRQHRTSQRNLARRPVNEQTTQATEELFSQLEVGP